MLQVLARDAQPRTAEAIHRDLHGACDLVTVYRSLENMEAAGVVRKVFSYSGVGLYCLEATPERLHVLVRDESVDVLDEVAPPAEMLLAVQSVEDVLRARGFTQISHAIQFFANHTLETDSSGCGADGKFINGL